MRLSLIKRITSSLLTCIFAIGLCSCALNNKRPTYQSSIESSEASESTAAESSSYSSKQDLTAVTAELKGEYQRIDTNDEREITITINDKGTYFIYGDFIGGKHLTYQVQHCFAYDSDDNLIITYLTGREKYKVVSDDNSLKLFASDSENADLVDMVFTKISDNTAVPPQRGEPKVGMTKDDILNKTWADRPHDTGILTTPNGTAETWYYEWGDISFVEDIVVIVNNGTVNQPSESTDDQGISDDYIRVGESFVRSNILYTFNAYENNCTNYRAGLAPKAGYKYIRLNITVKNIGKQDDRIYAAYFECYADNQKSNSVYDMTFNAEDGLMNADGILSPNRTATGSWAHLKTPSKQEHKRHGTKKAIFIPKRSKYRLK